MARKSFPSDGSKKAQQSTGTTAGLTILYVQLHLARVIHGVKKDIPIRGGHINFPVLVKKSSCIMPAAGAASILWFSPNWIQSLFSLEATMWQKGRHSKFWKNILFLQLNKFRIHLQQRSQSTKLPLWRSTSVRSRPIATWAKASRAQIIFSQVLATDAKNSIL